MPISQILLATGTGNGGGGGGGGGSNPPADFTIEWWQKVENNSNNPRPWSVGLYPTQQLAISYESGLSDYFWVNDNSVNNTVQSHIGVGWRHIAYVRSSGVIRGYINGTLYTPPQGITSTELITGTDVPLYVGTGESVAGTYKGYITNLHIMKGVAKYTDPNTFTVPTSPTILATGSVFLLPAVNDESKFYNSTGTAIISSETGTVAWSSDTPFTTDGPYIQNTNQSATNAIDFSGANYNADLLNVKAGWTVSDGAGQTGTVTSDAVDLGGNYIRIGITFTPVNAPSTIWTFTQPALGGSLYFNGSSYLDYGASAYWAIDAP
jgi:hypothetical protein